MHFLFKCSLYSDIRKQFYDNLCKEFPDLKKLNDINLLIWIMSNDNLKFISKFCEFVEVLFKVRKDEENAKRSSLLVCMVVPNF